MATGPASISTARLCCPIQRDRMGSFEYLDTTAYHVMFQRPDRVVMTYRITTYMAAAVDQIAMTLTIALSA